MSTTTAPSRADLDNACTKAEKLETQARHVLNSVGGHQDLERFKADLRLALDLYTKARDAYDPVFEACRHDRNVTARWSRLSEAVRLGTDALARWDGVVRPSDPFSRLLEAWKGNGFPIVGLGFEPLVGFDPAREGSEHTIKAVVGFETEGAGVRVVSVEEIVTPWSPDRSARWEVPFTKGDHHGGHDLVWTTIFRLGGLLTEEELVEACVPLTKGGQASWAQSIANIFLQAALEKGLLDLDAYDEAQKIGPWWSDRTGFLVYTITERVKPRAPAHKGVPLPLWWCDFEDLVEHGQGRVSTHEIARAGFDVEKLLTLIRTTGLFGVETVVYDTFTRTYVHAHGY